MCAIRAQSGQTRTLGLFGGRYVLSSAVVVMKTRGAQKGGRCVR